MRCCCSPRERGPRAAPAQLHCCCHALNRVSTKESGVCACARARVGACVRVSTLQHRSKDGERVQVEQPVCELRTKLRRSHEGGVRRSRLLTATAERAVSRTGATRIAADTRADMVRASASVQSSERTNTQAAAAHARSAALRRMTGVSVGASRPRCAHARTHARAHHTQPHTCADAGTARGEASRTRRQRMRPALLKQI